MSRPAKSRPGGDTPTVCITPCASATSSGLRSGSRGCGYSIVSDITKPKVIGQHIYHPPFPEPTHTVVPLPNEFNGRRYAAAVDEEHDHIPGQPHAGLWFFDVDDIANIKPVAMFHLQESASPFSRSTSRFGAHQFQERIAGDTMFCTWFPADSHDRHQQPERADGNGWYIPEPASGLKGPATNDVFVDKRDLIYTIDRDKGFDIIERMERGSRLLHAQI